MGAYSPLPWLPAGTVDEVMTSVVYPTLARMRELGTPFSGLLYVGTALTSKGRASSGSTPGSVTRRPRSCCRCCVPLAQVLYAAATGALAGIGELEFDDRAAVCVVLAAQGYPASPVKGCPITLPADGADAHVIHAGTALDADGNLVANGGRVLVVVATGDDLAAARAGSTTRWPPSTSPTGSAAPTSQPRPFDREE